MRLEGPSYVPIAALLLALAVACGDGVDRGDAAAVRTTSPISISTSEPSSTPTRTPTRKPTPNPTEMVAAPPARVAALPPDGPTCHLPPHTPTDVDAALGNGNGPFCVAWRDKFEDETGFRVEIHYSPSGERFHYIVPANTVEFLIPEEAWPYHGRPIEECLPRQAYTVSVLALRPAAETPVGGQSVIYECAQR